MNQSPIDAHRARPRLAGIAPGVRLVVFRPPRRRYDVEREQSPEYIKSNGYVAHHQFRMTLAFCRLVGGALVMCEENARLPFASLCLTITVSAPYTPSSNKKPNSEGSTGSCLKQ